MLPAERIDDTSHRLPDLHARARLRPLDGHDVRGILPEREVSFREVMARLSDDHERDDDRLWRHLVS
jgi:hypothetical protein